MPKTLKDLSAMSGINYYVLYYWLKIGLLIPTGKIGKNFIFDDAEIKNFKQIVSMRKQGLELYAIKQRLGR